MGTENITTKTIAIHEKREKSKQLTYLRDVDRRVVRHIRAQIQRERVLQRRVVRRKVHRVDIVEVKVARRGEGERRARGGDGQRFGQRARVDRPRGNVAWWGGGTGRHKERTRADESAN